MAMKIEFNAVAQGFDKVKSKVNNVFRSIKKEGSATKGILRGLFGSAAGTNMLLGLQMAGQVLGKIINTAKSAFHALKNIADGFDQIAKSARRTGVSFENFQKLTFVAQITGATFENVERTFRTFQQRLLDLKLGNVTKLNSLVKDLKLNSEALGRMNPLDAFLTVFERINQVGDPNMKRGLAQAFGGRGGTQTLPMIENFAAVADILKQFDLAIGSEALAGAEKFDDMMLMLSMQIKKVVAEFGILEIAAQQLAKANIAMLIARGKFGDNEDAFSSITKPFGAMRAVGKFTPVGFVMDRVMSMFGDINKNLGGAAKGFLPDLEQSLSKLRESLEISAISGAGGFGAARSSFNNMGGFSTAGMRAAGMNDPIFSELQKQTKELVEIKQGIVPIGWRNKAPGETFQDILNSYDLSGTIYSGGSE